MPYYGSDADKMPVCECWLVLCWLQIERERKEEREEFALRSNATTHLRISSGTSARAKSGNSYELASSVRYSFTSSG